ncbi:MAG: hypothetical protein KA535_11680 [Azonexus sp.]|nr:hypothetical protein [Azonexus sp.]
MHLTLLVPELIWPEPADQFTLGKLSAPGLEWLLARAQLERQPRRPYENVLTDCFELAAGPFGPLRLLGEGSDEARAGHWLCADPVHLRFHQERIILADAGAFDLADDEAQAIVESLNAEFADIGRFHVASARHWYLQLNVAVDHPVEPISAVAGRRVDGELSGSALPLARWLNEVQMFLHGHPVNERRQATGQPAINSLWLWGGGTLPAVAAPAFSAVFGANPLAVGLARAAGIPLHDRPATLADMLASGGNRPLVVLDQLLARVLYEDSDGWRREFEQLDRDWFVPLKNALGGKVDRISLLAPTVYGELRYTLTAGDRWKVWKRGKPIAETAKELAQ